MSNGKQQEGPPLWERQEWDTAASFNAFSLHYFTQEPPRSLDAAYRKAKPKRGRAGNKRDTRRAPTRWRIWAQGKDSKGNKIPGAKTWAERAEAWDDYVAAQIVKRHEEKQAEIIAGMQAAYDKTLERWLGTLSKYQPQGETIGEITLSLQRLADVGRKAYGIPDEPQRHEIGAPGEFPAAAPTHDKIAEIARLFEQARQRQAGNAAAAEDTEEGAT